MSDYGPFAGIEEEGEDLTDLLERAFKAGDTVLLTGETIDAIGERLKHLSTMLLANGGAWS